MDAKHPSSQQVVTLAVHPRRRLWRAVPLGLALAMLGVVVLAGLLPDTGLVSASSNCSYGKCPSSSSFPLWAVSASVAVVLIAIILALLLLRRSRRRPPSGEAAGASAGAGGTAGSGQDWSEGSEAPQGDSENPPANDPGTPMGDELDGGTSSR